MNGPLVIDTKMHGFEGITGAFVLRGEKTALIETGPKTSVETVLAGLDANGIEHLDWIIVTHIHLDHAGAAGTLAARFPAATIAVHSVGAPHLVSPAKLWASAARIYGNEMDELWGGIDPIPQERIRVIDDGDKIDLGGRSLQAIETPGHAYHHHAYLDDSTGMVFTGDALGVRLASVPAVRPATPPPEFHLAKAIESIERIKGVGASSLCLTHFGPSEVDPAELCDQGIEALLRWATWVRDARVETREHDEVTEKVRSAARGDAEGRLDQADVDRLEQTTSYEMNVSGYMRYMDKNEPDAR
ncbi:MAG: MBL fold metallo-hydrolase [Actinomycetota bacterium]